MEKIPKELLTQIPPEQRAVVLGRYAILNEMGFFGLETNVSLARHSGPGTWMAAVRKRFSGTYGDVGGCHPADIEIAAEYLGVFDEVFDAEASQASRHIQDRAA